MKEMLIRQKMAKLAPPYIDKLKKDYNVEIVDPSLKSMSDAAAADSAGKATPGSDK